jgi:hypothetical protein
MDHRVDAVSLAVVAASFVGRGEVASRAERGPVTTPMAVVALGPVVAPGPVTLGHHGLPSSTQGSGAEVTRALVLMATGGRRRTAAARSHRGPGAGPKGAGAQP